MSKRDSNLDLPALSADESGGNMTYSSNLSQLPQQQKNFTPVSTTPFMDFNFFYGLDQLAPDNPLFFMQQQQQQQQQHQNQNQHNESTMYGDQFLKEAVNGEGSSSTTLAQSISSSMASFQAAITSSVGEQPPSFWTGLNNVNNFLT